jgi:coproporphyrinogen III oxidase-like Fe-S oxidoreductase
MSEKAYRKYVESGPDALGGEELREALSFRDVHPTEAFAIREHHEVQRREAENRALLEETWLWQGGDLSQFQQAYKELSGEQRKEKLKALEAEKAEWHRRAGRAF